MPLLLPFRSYELQNFPDAHIPLAEARPNPAAAAETERRRVSRMDDDNTPVNPATKSTESNLSASGESLQKLREEVEVDVAADGRDSAYDRKSKVINQAIQDIGMGTYQWRLFVLCGFGWLADNLWLQGVALTLPSLTSEFNISPTHIRFTTLALYAGLCCGAVLWGTIADVMGRRFAFNATLLIAAIFGLSVASAQSWMAVCGLYAALGVGVGGNLPVDGTLFLEFLPLSSGNLLTMLSVFWPLGQLLASIIAWGFIPGRSCDRPTLGACASAAAGEPCCTTRSNMGWRYLNVTMGAITMVMFICRFFLFHLFESPKFLLSRGRQGDAVTVVRAVAYQNGTRTWLDEDILNAIGGRPDELSDGKLSVGAIIRRQLGRFSKQRIAPLFGSKKLGTNTALLWCCWAVIGMGYPLFNAFLPQYLIRVDPGTPETPPNIVYRNYAIVSIVGVPGSILAWYTVEMAHVGRKGTMAIAAALTAVCLFVFTERTDSGFQLALTCLQAFFQNIMYGVLYAYTPEIFPAPNRGTGTGIASFLNRITGLCAPLVGIYSGAHNPKVPIYVSGALILSACVTMCLFPIESRGRQTL